MRTQPLPRQTAEALAPGLLEHRERARKVAAILATNGDNFAAGAISNLLDAVDLLVAELPRLPPIYR